MRPFVIMVLVSLFFFACVATCYHHEIEQFQDDIQACGMRHLEDLVP